MKTDPEYTKKIPLPADLDEEGEEDMYCDLDPTKICDNCFKCLETDSDYATVEIDGIYMNGERLY